MRIEGLERYERLPGEYFAVQVLPANLRPLEDLLGAVQLGRDDLPAEFTVDSRGDPVVALPLDQYRENVLRIGDWITFRRDPTALGGWSVITYADGDFRARFRRAGA